MGLSHADKILKVNHAGELGAVNMYRGQRRDRVRHLDRDEVLAFQRE